MTPGLIGFESLSDAGRLADVVLGLMPDAAVMVVDPDHRVVVMQGAAYERHGHDPVAAIGRDLRDVIPAAAWARLGEHWDAALAGASRTLDFESVDGRSVFWLHFAPAGPAERPIGAVMVARGHHRPRAGEGPDPAPPDAAGSRQRPGLARAAR